MYFLVLFLIFNKLPAEQKVYFLVFFLNKLPAEQKEDFKDFFVFFNKYGFACDVNLKGRTRCALVNTPPNSAAGR